MCQTSDVIGYKVLERELNKAESKSVQSKLNKYGLNPNREGRLINNINLIVRNSSRPISYVAINHSDEEETVADPRKLSASPYKMAHKQEGK
jgi:hypothetical protein